MSPPVTGSLAADWQSLFAYRVPAEVPEHQHEPVEPVPVGSRLPTCRLCGIAYLEWED